MACAGGYNAHRGCRKKLLESLAWGLQGHEQHSGSWFQMLVRGLGYIHSSTVANCGASM